MGGLYAKGFGGIAEEGEGVQKGVECGSETGPVEEGVENISREPVSMASTLGEQYGELYYVMMN